MAPRIPLLAPDAAHAAAAEVGVTDLAADLNVFRAWLHHPRLAGALNDALMLLLGGTHLDHRLRELIILRLGWVTGSDYEWTQHWRLGIDLFGVPADDALGVRNWREHDGFGPAERAVLTATDEVVEHGVIGAATWTECVAQLGDDPKVLLELVTTIGLWRMVSSILRSLEIPLEDGVASWPPEGESPPSPPGVR